MPGSSNARERRHTSGGAPLIVFDLDNTLVDEFGRWVRPGMRELLETLQAETCDGLALWTSSTRQRALGILRHHQLDGCFHRRLFREDYDPDNRGAFKEIQRIGGGFLIEDDPRQIAHVRQLGLAGFLITPYRSGGSVDGDELTRLAREIQHWRRGPWWRFW